MPENMSTEIPKPVHLSSIFRLKIGNKLCIIILSIPPHTSKCFSLMILFIFYFSFHFLLFNIFHDKHKVRLNFNNYAYGMV